MFATATRRRLGLSLFVARPERLSADEAAENTRALAQAPWFDETLTSLRAYEFPAEGDIPVPVTVAWGSKDRLLLPRQARRAAASSARSLESSRMGHLLVRPR
jgi:pimeloyl-ACP methyl ester carboxylesterase